MSEQTREFTKELTREQRRIDMYKRRALEMVTFVFERKERSFDDLPVFMRVFLSTLHYTQIVAPLVVREYNQSGRALSCSVLARKYCLEVSVISKIISQNTPTRKFSFPDEGLPQLTDITENEGL